MPFNPFSGGNWSLLLWSAPADVGAEGGDSEKTWINLVATREDKLRVECEVLAGMTAAEVVGAAAAEVDVDNLNEGTIEEIAKNRYLFRDLIEWALEPLNLDPDELLHNRRTEICKPAIVLFMEVTMNSFLKSVLGTTAGKGGLAGIAVTVGMFFYEKYHSKKRSVYKS